MRWQWERIQVKLFKISDQGIWRCDNTQQRGFHLATRPPTYIISFIAARAGRARGYDAGYDDVGDLHRGAALFAYRAN